MVIEDKNLEMKKINLLISKFELESLQNISQFLSLAKKRLVISLSLLSNLEFCYLMNHLQL